MDFREALLFLIGILREFNEERAARDFEQTAPSALRNGTIYYWRGRPA